MSKLRLDWIQIHVGSEIHLPGGKHLIIPKYFLVTMPGYVAVSFRSSGKILPSLIIVKERLYTTGNSRFDGSLFSSSEGYLFHLAAYWSGALHIRNSHSCHIWAMGTVHRSCSCEAQLAVGGASQKMTSIKYVVHNYVLHDIVPAAVGYGKAICK